MKANTTTYTQAFESALIKTMDARKDLKVQTVIGSNGTVTTNLMMIFKSDKKDDKGYIKALAFSLENSEMIALNEALVTAQKALNAEKKKNPTLSARPQVTATVTLSGNAQVDALRKAGLTDEQIKALNIEIPEEKPATPKKATTKKKAEPVETTEDDDINDLFNKMMAVLTPAQKKKIQKGGVNGAK